MPKFKKILTVVMIHVALIGCSITDVFKNQSTNTFTQVYQVIGDHQVIIRAITNTNECPSIAWDSLPAKPLKIRANPSLVPLRKKSDEVASNFPIKTCEIIWPKGVLQAKINNQVFTAPKEEVNRILILADTGCRLKAADNAFQDCNDAQKWPFEKIVLQAAKMNPDLVVHVGDIHYRESPCPPDQLGCKNSPWGYGFDTWKADFFDPAKPLLDNKPWVFVRGNHESCQRAGQGWHRFIDDQSWDDKKSCNNPQNDQEGNYRSPYAVGLGKSAQIIVFDSANIPSKELKNEDVAFNLYFKQIELAERLAKNKSFNIFSNHHPISIVTPSKIKSDNGKFVLSGNALSTVMEKINANALLSSSFNATLHGHIHVAEAIDYQFPRPVSLISGNGGSALEFNGLKEISLSAEQKKEMNIENIQTFLNFGFATLDRKDKDGLQWLFTEFNVDGQKVFSCLIASHNGKSSCTKVNN
ncbi:MAG: metallophosphoesterase [Betaproteobacteria bacterium]